MGTSRMTEIMVWGREERNEVSTGAVENDRKHDDLCVGSMGIRPMDQQRTS